MSAAALQLATAAVQLSKAALSLLDLQQHTATHPRLGVVDHITCNPLGTEAQLSSAAEAAQSIGTRCTAAASNLLHSSLQRAVRRTYCKRKGVTTALLRNLLPFYGQRVRAQECEPL